MELGEKDQARFWVKVALPDSNGCMLWMASTWDGYGRFKLGGAMRQAHRLSYAMAYGSVPAGLQLDHLCRVRHCVAPDHLEPVTSQENSRRGSGVAAKNAAKTHCLRGHRYDDANTYIPPAGGRRCLACQRIRDLARGDRIQISAAHGYAPWNGEGNW
ncbi:MAG: HNH endonuclease signature motif containing protein [Humibacter sp.]